MQVGADTKRVKPFFPQWLASQKIVLGHYLHVGYFMLGTDLYR